MRRSLRATVSSSAAFLLAISIAVAPASSASPLAGDEKAALTNQEIVRMVASGMEADRIVARIESSRCEFDLDPDMIVELKAAGVPDQVLDAMKRKSRRSQMPPPADRRKEAKGEIEIDFDDDPALNPRENSVEIPAVIGNPKTNTPIPLEMAFAVTCDRPDHVPDFWEQASPMGESPGRHQVLFFESATSKPDKGLNPRSRIYLTHPPSWRFDAEAGVHRGMIAVVVGPAGAPWPDGTAEYIPLVLSSFANLVVEEGRLTRVKVQLRSGKGSKAPEADPTHPVASSPDLTNIGTTAMKEIGLNVSITIVTIGAPEPMAPAGTETADPNTPQGR